jgi:arylsulfatase
VLYIENGELAYEYNAYGELIKLPGTKIKPGKLDVVFHYTATGKQMGQYTLSVNGNKYADGPLGPVTAGGAPHEGLDIGIDRRAPVSWDVYEKHGAFPYTGKGVIESVTYAPGPVAPDTSMKIAMKAPRHEGLFLGDRVSWWPRYFHRWWWAHCP